MAPVKFLPTGHFLSQYRDPIRIFLDQFTVEHVVVNARTARVGEKSVRKHKDIRRLNFHSPLTIQEW